MHNLLILSNYHKLIYNSPQITNNLPEALIKNIMFPLMQPTEQICLKYFICQKCECNIDKTSNNMSLNVFGFDCQ